MIEVEGTWRDDSSLTSTNTYKKKFAFFPAKVSGGKVWLKFYYKKYRTWFHEHGHLNLDGDTGHTEFLEAISEEEYVVRKLAERL
jgi:hypothetical protein